MLLSDTINFLLGKQLLLITKLSKETWNQNLIQVASYKPNEKKAKMTRTELIRFSQSRPSCIPKKNFNEFLLYVAAFLGWLRRAGKHFNGCINGLFIKSSEPLFQFFWDFLYLLLGYLSHGNNIAFCWLLFSQQLYLK